MSEPPIEIGEIDLNSEPPEQPDGKRKQLRRVLLTALVTVTVAGAGALAYAGWQVSSQKDAELITPDVIGALRLDKSEDGLSTADYLRTALSAEVDLDESVAGVYADGTGKNVLFMGGTGLIWTPENDLDVTFELVADNEGSVTGVHEVDAGDLGGTMKCGSTKSSEGDLTVCGWADHGSIALAMLPNRTEQEAAPLLREIRSSVQTRK